MNRRLFSAFAACALLASAACKKNPEAPYKKLNLETSVAAHKAGAVFFDANTEDFRRANGKVPGAVLLASSSAYDVATTLPADKDKQLIFYCTSPV